MPPPQRPPTPPDPGEPDGRAARGRAPAALMVAASLGLIEALLVLGYGVALLTSVHVSRLAMGVSTPVFFCVYGVALGWCAWQLARVRSWARAPVVLAQLIQLGLAYNFWGGGTTPVAIAMAVAGVLVLIGTFHPASINALAEPEDSDGQE